MVPEIVLFSGTGPPVVHHRTVSSLQQVLQPKEAEPVGVVE